MRSPDMKSWLWWIGGFPALTVGFALVVNVFFHRWLGTYGLMFLFLIAISAAVNRAGVLAGLIATALAAVSVLYFLVEPWYTWQVAQPEDWCRLLIFGVCGIAAVAATRLAERHGRNFLKR